MVADDICLQKVELYVEGSFVAEIVLPPASNSAFEFNFDTKTLDDGWRTIEVRAFDTSSNNAGQNVTVLLTYGDVNGDRVIDMKDLYQIILHFMCKVSDPCYVPNCDINWDGVIDMKDIYTIILQFRKSW